MAAFLDNVRFNPTAGGLTDWTVSTNVTGYQTPASAGAVNGRAYKYFAISSDSTQWEIGEGAYNTTGPVLPRTTILYSTNANAKVNFATVPTVAIIAVKEDLISIEEANSFTATQKAQARANIDALKRNYIVNGGMMVSQENGTTAGTTSGYYPVDQWSIQASSMGTGTFSVAQVASTTPGGSPNRTRVTVTAAQATIGTSVCFLQQKIEGYRSADLLFGTANAKTITLAMGVKAPVSGTYTAQILNAAASAALSGSFTIAAGEVNTDVVKTVTFAGPTTGTWTTDNSAGLTLEVFLLNTGSANVFATNGNVFELFDVGLYEGASAPSFQLQDFFTELQSCKRYFEKSYDYGTAKGTATITGYEWIFSSSLATQAGKSVGFSVEKRADPTMTFYSPNSGASGNAYDYQAAADVAVNLQGIGTHGFAFYVNKSNLATNVGTHWVATARM